MDAFSISVNALTLAGFCGKLALDIGRFLVDTRGAATIVSEFHKSIQSLESALQGIDAALKQRPHELPLEPFEQEHLQNINQIIRSCDEALEKLTGQLPPLAINPNTFTKVRMSIESSLKSNTVRQTLAHVNSYTQVLHLSLTTLSLGCLWRTQRSQEQIQAEVRYLTGSIRSARLISFRTNISGQAREPDIEDQAVVEANMAVARDIEAWRTSADDLAAMVSLHDPDQLSIDAQSLNRAFLGRDSAVDVGSDSEAELRVFDPEPGHEDCPSQEILQDQIKKNQEDVEKLVRDDIFLKAASIQRKVMIWKAQLSNAYGVTFTYDEQADMKEFLAEILLGTETIDGVREAREILERLLQAEVQPDSEGTDRYRRCRLYHKLGNLYMEQGYLSRAKVFLGRAFEGRKKMNPMPREDAIESAKSLVRVLHLGQALPEARGYMEWIRRETQPKPQNVNEHGPASAGDANLSIVFAWCMENGFDIDDPNFRFEEYDPVRGTSPLHQVIEEENLLVFRQMVSSVVSLEHRDAALATPLLLACSTRNKEIVGVLLENGAKVDVRDGRLMSPLHRCQDKKGGVNAAELLLQRRPAGESPLVNGSTRPDFIDAADVSGRTALYMACENGNEKMARCLLKAHAISDLKDNFGKTALYRACEKGDDKMVRCLLEYQANPNITGPGECTPLVIAIDVSIKIGTKIAIVEMLLAHGADPRIADTDGQDAFVATRKVGFGSEIRRLLGEADSRRPSAASTSTSGSGASGGRLSASGSDITRPRLNSAASRQSRR